MKITVGLPCYNSDCKVWFMHSLLKTQWPKDSEREILYSIGMWTPNAYLKFAKRAIENNSDYLLVISLDAGWPPDAVQKYVDADVDVISGWALGRQPPHTLHVVDKYNPKKKMFQVYQRTGKERGLMQCLGVGGEMVMFKTSAFKRMPPPWFFGPDMVDNPESMMTEDYYFARQAMKHHVKVYVHWDVPLTHGVESIVTSGGKMTRFM